MVSHGDGKAGSVFRVRSHARISVVVLKPCSTSPPSTDSPVVREYLLLSPFFLGTVSCLLSADRSYPSARCVLRKSLQDLKGVVRSHSFCGLQGEFFLAQCSRFIGCFEESESAYAWAHCMEENVSNSPPSLCAGCGVVVECTWGI